MLLSRKSCNVNVHFLHQRIYIRPLKCLICVKCFWESWHLFRHHEMSIHFEKRICKKPGLIGLMCVGGVKLFSTIILLKSSPPGVLWLYETPRFHLKRQVRKWAIRFVGKILNAPNPGNGTIFCWAKSPQSWAQLFYLKIFWTFTQPCYILFLSCRRSNPAPLPWLKLPCSQPTSNLRPVILSQLLQYHMRAGVQVTLCMRLVIHSSQRVSAGALRTKLPFTARSHWRNFPLCHRSLGWR